MSLDMSLTDADGNIVAEMNWLRNPYGLCDWMEDNIAYARREERSGDLWHVINHWYYDASGNVDRPLFKATVERYAEVIERIPEIYFWFDVGQYMHFVQPHMHIFPHSAPLLTPSGEGIRIQGNHFHLGKIGLPMHYFEAPCFYLRHPGMEEKTLVEHYRNWVRRLMRFADLLQDESLTFYRSN